MSPVGDDDGDDVLPDQDWPWALVRPLEPGRPGDPVRYGGPESDAGLPEDA